MNDHDRKNLEFLLTASPEVIKDWYRSVDKDDHQYAIELLESACLELLERPVNLSMDCSQAKELLSKYTLKTKT
jgi:hypothetical protein